MNTVRAIRFLRSCLCALALVLVGATLKPQPARAIGENVIIEYFDSSWENIVGQERWSCTGRYTHWGSMTCNYHYEAIDCDSGNLDEDSYHYCP